MMLHFKVRTLSLFFILLLTVQAAKAFADPLPSWNNGPIKEAILQFVSEVTDKGGKNYVPEAERIAVFDQDGTLWVEQPLYTQQYFALDRIKEMSGKDPVQKKKQADDLEGRSDAKESEIEAIVAKTHAGMTIEDFHDIVKDWLLTARHPRYKRAYTDLVYEPMLEVIRLLKANGFKVYIVSGGGQEFIRSYAEKVYGIPPEQIIGTAGRVKYEYEGGTPVLRKKPAILFIDDKDGKPEAINLIIGRKPIVAFGNSDGDKQMLEWTGDNPGAHLEVLISHDDDRREYSYGPDSKIGTFSEGLKTDAELKGWKVVSMKKDWNRIFRWEGSSPQPKEGSSPKPKEANVPGKDPS